MNTQKNEIIPGSDDLLEISQTAKDERETLKFWDDNSIFKKSIDNRDGSKEFNFYDGPPFGTGLPHYGHIVPGTIKDVLPRYKTMKGFKVERKWGWDCHGLPIENMIEKEMGLNSKQDIEKYGIDKFNKKCKESVLRYESEWKKVVPKTGRFVDMDRPYKTMDSNYTESLWWAFSELSKKGLVSKDFKPMHVCPRCETTLSNNEVSDGYQDIKDLSVTAKFELLEEPNTFILAWTTTPWTLPGNVALAIGKDINYIKTSNSQNTEKYIFAKELFEKIQKEAGFDLEITAQLKGLELVGKSYKPLFNYYSESEDLKDKENGWKIYEADFVTTDAGTGIVHIAPAFGEDDLKLGKKNNLPWVQHVKINGQFKDEVLDFAGTLVRKKDFHEESDIEIIKNLAGQGKLFFKEKYEHSYPHCWRCKTPLLNYATSSWFINSPKIKERLVSENKKVSWVPKHIGEKRFHNWLDNTRDWAVSRSRYWGAPIPIWENKETGDYKVLGSLAELKNKTRSKNNFVVFRHGQSQANISDILSFEKNKNGDSLTIEGKERVKTESKNIGSVLTQGKNTNGEKVDVIFSSPFNRTKETSKIIKSELGFLGEIIFDDRLSETNFGEGNNGAANELLRKAFLSESFNGEEKMCGGESFLDINKRVFDFLYEVDKKYEGKNIVIVSHHLPISVILSGVNAFKKRNDDNIKNSTPYLLDFAPFPCDENFQLDYHRPFIDDISFYEDGKKYEFIGDVFDCWFESGSMPYASKHYPFENKDKFDPEKGIGFPADFISEGQDQTRGWFNSMLTLSVALFGETAFKNVIVHGMLMADNGKKLSKSDKNYPPVDEVLDKYGGDSLRLFLLSSPIVKGDSPSFHEKGVDDMMKKVVMKTKNILAFYELYKNGVLEERNSYESKNILDKWILEKTKKLILEVESGLENYKIDDATKPFVEFVDDFSTWFIRRSRDRFKGDDIEDRDLSIATTKEVLRVFSKVISPFAPFLADYVWVRVRSEEDKESVHLEDWPKAKSSLAEKIIKNDIIEVMDSVREVVSVGLEARTVQGLKVRQPIQSVLVLGASGKVDQKYFDLIKDELNIKEVFFEKDLESALSKKYNDFSDELDNLTKDSNKKIIVILNKNISKQLQEEGDYREFLRQVQIMRKNAGMKVADKVELKVDLGESEKEFIENFRDDLEKTAGVVNINYSSIADGDITKINKKEIRIVLIEI
jgi:isoleucyl-tRNA synthetase